MINEMYWITRLTDVKEGLEVSFVIATVTAVFALIGALIACDTPEVLKPLRRLLTVSTVIAGIAGIGYMLTPTAHEALMIYGYGAAKDYYNSNNTLQKIPTKVVDYLDSILTTKEKDGEK